MIRHCGIKIVPLKNYNTWTLVLQGVFFNWPPLKMPRLAPPKSFKYENHIEVLRHLDFFRSWGGPVWDSNAFWKLVTYRQIQGGGS